MFGRGKGTQIMSHLLLVLWIQIVLHGAHGTVDVDVDESRYRERSFTRFEGEALQGSVVAVFRVDSSLDCGFYCTGDSTCQSYNLKVDVGGKYTCEINNASKSTSNSSAYISKTGSTYYEIEPKPKPPKICAAVGRGSNFTTLGASGRVGPTSLGSHYQGQPHELQVTLVNGIQQWTVPSTEQYQIKVVGASGGYDKQANSKAYRGRGASMVGTFKLEKNQVIKILVGQEGGINTGSSSSGGGGGSFVAHGSTPLIVAGGGGGIEGATTRHSDYCDASVSTSGRNGYGGKSWAGGTAGQGATTADSSNSGGGGGGFYSDGRSSTNFGGSYGKGGEGGKGFVNGGIGGRSHRNIVPGGFGGGSGAYGGGGGAGSGGGYSGGASGDNNVDSCGGGGGSFNSGTDQQNVCCVNYNGHGFVMIMQLSCLP